MTSTKLKKMVSQLIVDSNGINPFYSDVHSITSFSNGVVIGKIKGRKVSYSSSLRLWRIQ